MSEREDKVETTAGVMPEPPKRQNRPQKVNVETTENLEAPPKPRGMFNLQDHDYAAASEEGSWMDVVDEKDFRPTGLQIFVYGPDSEQVRAARNQFASRLNILQQRTRRRKQNYDDVIEGNQILALGATGGWRVRDDNGKWVNLLPWGDDLLEFSRKNAKRVYEEFTFIAEQVADYMEERANFLSD